MARGEGVARGVRRVRVGGEDLADVGAVRIGAGRGRRLGRRLFERD